MGDLTHLHDKYPWGLYIPWRGITSQAILRVATVSWSTFGPWPVQSPRKSPGRPASLCPCWY